MKTFPSAQRKPSILGAADSHSAPSREWPTPQCHSRPTEPTYLRRRLRDQEGARSTPSHSGAWRAWPAQLVEGLTCLNSLRFMELIFKKWREVMSGLPLEPPPV